MVSEYGHLNGLDAIEFGLVERRRRFGAKNILHCVVDTVTRRAWLTSDAYGELNQDRDIGTKISTKGLQALDDAFARLREFIMASASRCTMTKPGRAAALLDQEPSLLLVLAFQRVGLELVHAAHRSGDFCGRGSRKTLRCMTWNALAQYVRQEFLRMGKTVCTFPLWDGGELIAYAPEARLRLRRAADAATGYADGGPSMNTIEAAALAAELRKAAQDLLLCVNAIMGQEQSIAADQGASGVASENGK